MWKKRILPLLCALALLAGLLPGRVQAAQTKPVRYLTVTARQHSWRPGGACRRPHPNCLRRRGCPSSDPGALV